MSGQLPGSGLRLSELRAVAKAERKERRRQEREQSRGVGGVVLREPAVLMPSQVRVREHVQKRPEFWVLAKDRVARELLERAEKSAVRLTGPQIVALRLVGEDEVSDDEVSLRELSRRRLVREVAPGTGVYFLRADGRRVLELV